MYFLYTSIDFNSPFSSYLFQQYIEGNKCCRAINTRPSIKKIVIDINNNLPRKLFHFGFNVYSLAYRLCRTVQIKR